MPNHWAKPPSFLTILVAIGWLACPPAQASAEKPARFEPWTKYCAQLPSGGDHKACFTGRDALLESGTPLVALLLVENDDDAHTPLLHVRVPLGIDLKKGLDVAFDDEPAQQLQYIGEYPVLDRSPEL
jgi:invasion protein IalB